MIKTILLAMVLYVSNNCNCQFCFFQINNSKNETLTKKNNENILILNKYFIKDSIKIDILDFNLKIIKSETFNCDLGIEKKDIIDFDLYLDESNKFLIILLRDNYFYIANKLQQGKKHKINSNVTLNELKINSSAKVYFYNNLFSPKTNKRSSEVILFNLIDFKQELLFFTKKVKCNILNIVEYQKFIDVSEKYLVTMMPYEFSFHVTNIENRITKTSAFRKNDAKIIDSLERISKEYHILHNYESIENAQVIDDNIVRPNACYIDKDTLYVLFKKKNDSLTTQDFNVFDVNLYKFEIDMNLNLNLLNEFNIGILVMGSIKKDVKIGSNIKDFNYPLLDPYTKLIINNRNVFYIENLNLEKISHSINYIDYFKAAKESDKSYLIKKKLISF